MNNDTNNDSRNTNPNRGVPPKQIQIKLPFEKEEPEVAGFDEGGNELKAELADELGVN
jgi:hypothetical protein